MLDAAAMCAAVLAMLSAIELIIYGLSADGVAALVINIGFLLMYVAGWRRGVCLWIGLSLVIVAVCGMDVPYFYIILLFFIDISKFDGERIFILYLLIALATGISGNTSVTFMVEQMTMMGGVLYLFGNRRRHTPLVLTNDEERILMELATGKQQKEIRRWNKNTVSKKLKQARERNGCLSNSELLLLYRGKNGSLPANADQSHIPSDL